MEMARIFSLTVKDDKSIDDDVAICQQEKKKTQKKMHAYIQKN